MFTYSKQIEVAAKKKAHIYDKRFMMKALKLAKKGVGFVSPNPLVGAVLVKNNRIVAQGYHKRFGGPHAEVECLKRYRGSYKSTSLYLNLEPCAHYGKTPPCVDQIIKTGIKHVIVAMKDPNPKVAGRGIRKLRQAGIKVIVGVLEQEAQELNKWFVHHITARIPFIHLKIAQTINGSIARNGGASRWISSQQSRTMVHQWRAQHDAVLVGAGTLNIDDPFLSVRLAKGRNPDVVILDGKLRSAIRARVFDSRDKRRIFICTSQRVADPGTRRKLKALVKRGVIVLRFQSVRSILPLRKVLAELYRHNIGSILVEGGSYVFSEFLAQGLVNQLSVFIAPRVMIDGVPAFQRNILEASIASKTKYLKKLRAQIVERDVLIQGFF